MGPPKKEGEGCPVKNKKEQAAFHLMLLPGMLILLVFSFIPMFGIVMAFQNFVPAKGLFGSPWVGLEHFQFMFSLPDSSQIFANTLIIAIGKIVFHMIVAVVFALLLNELHAASVKKAVQTVVYLPHFLSWVVLSTVVINMFSYEGPVNQLLTMMGGKPVLFLASNTWFRPVVIATDVWKEFGYNSIIYLAALTGVDPGLYEAANIDGANRWKQTLHITLPALLPTLLMMCILNMGSILSAGFDQIYNLYNPLVYETGDIIDTYVYRVGLVQRQYSLGTAVGLLKSAVSFILIVGSNTLADRFAQIRVF